jgi:membrane protein implicated in regulation of membrane protease activity
MRTAGYQTRTDDRTISELLSEVTGEMSQLLHKEVELAKLETKEQVSRASRAGALFGASGVGAFVALVLLAMAAAWGLAEIMAPGVAFGVVGVLFLLVSVLLLSIGRRKLAEVQPPRLDTMKQDVRAAKTSLSSGARGAHTYRGADWVGGTG